MPKKNEDTIQTREDVFRELHEVYRCADKAADKIRALDKIAEIRGLKAVKSLGNLQGMKPHELVEVVKEIVIPALEDFTMEEAIHEVEGTAQ